MPIVDSGGSIRRDIFLIVGIVQDGPFFLLFIPPDQLLAFAPRLSIGTCRSTVVNDAAVIRPGKAPPMSEQISGIPLVGAVIAVLGIYTAVNPRSASCRSIILQVTNVL